MSDKKLSWLYDLINFGGAVTGIILTAIGGTMLLNSALKLYVFKFDSNEYSYVRMEDCRYDYNKPQVVALAKDNDNKVTERSDEEIKKCMNNRKAEEKQRYTRNKQENMVDGLAMLIVGIPFWIIFDRRRQFSLKKKK